MKVNTSFTLRTIGDMNLIVPLKEDTFFKENVLTVNETGALLWKYLADSTKCPPHIERTYEATKKELLTALQAVYDVDDETALADIDSFLKRLQKINAIYA